MRKPTRQELLAQKEKQLQEQLNLISRQLHYARLFIEQKKYQEAGDAAKNALRLIEQTAVFNTNKYTAARI